MYLYKTPLGGLLVQSESLYGPDPTEWRPGSEIPSVFLGPLQVDYWPGVHPGPRYIRSPVVVESYQGWPHLYLRQSSPRFGRPSFLYHGVTIPFLFLVSPPHRPLHSLLHRFLGTAVVSLYSHLSTVILIVVDPPSGTGKSSLNFVPQGSGVLIPLISLFLSISFSSCPYVPSKTLFINFYPWFRLRVNILYPVCPP